MPILLFLIILLFLVLVHEFGHFIVAKRSGIRVDEFAFGFPPRLFGIKKGETTYAFNALPLGGYVKIYGEDPTAITDADRGRSFVAQPRLIQSAVVVAGIAFNVLFAWVLLSATFMVGIPATAESAAPYAISTPALSITGVVTDSPAARAGVLPGDRILSLADGEERVVGDMPETVTGFVGPREGRPVTLSYLRDGAKQEVTIVPVGGIVEDRAAIGISMDMVGTLRLPLFDALSYGAIKTYEYTRLTAEGILGFLAQAFTGRANFTDVTGPVGIVHAVGDAAELGVANLLLFTAIISINLAVINILPFPALDGGRLLFILVEAIMRRPIAPVIANSMNMIGFGLLMFLMVLVTYHDLVRFF